MREKEVYKLSSGLPGHTHSQVCTRTYTDTHTHTAPHAQTNKYNKKIYDFILGIPTKVSGLTLIGPA